MAAWDDAQTRSRVSRPTSSGGATRQRGTLTSGVGGRSCGAVSRADGSAGGGGHGLLGLLDRPARQAL